MSVQEQITIKPGIYRHYKGNLYRVIGTARHSETEEQLVAYEALYNNPKGKLWARPLSMFAESVEVKGIAQPRFKYVEDSRKAGVGVGVQSYPQNALA